MILEKPMCHFKTNTLHTMKSIKYLIVFSLVFTCLQSTFAQMNDGAQFGIKAGINGANLYDDAKAQDKKSRIGYTAGVFGQFRLGRAVFPSARTVVFRQGVFTFISKRHNPEIEA